MDHCHVFHTDAVHRSYPISDAKGVCVCVLVTQRHNVLPGWAPAASLGCGSARLPAASLPPRWKQRSPGRRGEGCPLHPAPTAWGDRWLTHTHTHTRWYPVLQQESESVDKGWVNHYWQAPVCEWPPVHPALTSLCHYCTTVLKLKCFAEDFNMIAAHATIKSQATTLSDLCCIWHSTLPRCAVSNIMVFIWVWVRNTGMDGKRQKT